jgi:lysophospholipase L1-like esterase
LIGSKLLGGAGRLAVRLAFVGLIAGCSSSASAAWSGSEHGLMGVEPADGRIAVAEEAPRLGAPLTVPGAASVPVVDTAPPTEPADPYAAYVNPPARPAVPRRFVVLGDSLSAWVYDAGQQPTTAGTWPALVADREPGLVLVHNASLPGNHTLEMLARMKRDVFAYRPDLLFILGGTNDIADLVPDATIVDNTRQMIHAARARGIEVVLLTVPPNNKIWPYMRPHFREVSAALVALGIEENAAVVDLYGAMARRDGSLRPAFAAPDRLHLSSAGQRAIADAVCTVLHPTGPPAHD